jgi:hypothetical protein
MSTLLDEITEQLGGGLSRWREASSIEADGAFGGLLWEHKGHPDFVGTDHIVADIHRQHVTLTQPSGRVVEFDKDADLLTVTAPDGTVERLEHPRASFEGYGFENRWSVAQAGYFRAYATWQSLIGSYLLVYPGVEVSEIDPWIEDGANWRGVRAALPARIDGHDTTQRYYFDAEARCVLMAYDAQINGGVPTAHYLLDPVVVDGLVVAGRHEIFACDESGAPDRSWMPVSLELSGITVH